MPEHIRLTLCSAIFCSFSWGKSCAREVAGPIVVTPPCAWVAELHARELARDLGEILLFLLLCYYDSRKVAVSY